MFAVSLGYLLIGICVSMPVEDGTGQQTCEYLDSSPQYISYFFVFNMYDVHNTFCDLRDSVGERLLRCNDPESVTNAATVT